MVDYLIMLLSTDWFRPYWSEIGIEIDEAAKTEIQQGCRKIVGQILSGAEHYYLVSFSDQRRNETRSELDSLVRSCGAAQATFEVILEWAETSNEDQKAAWICSNQADDLLTGDVRADDPRLDPAIEAVMNEAVQQYLLATWKFSDLSESSKTAWDEYTKQLTPEQPTALADVLASVLTARRFRLFSNRVNQKLTESQRRALCAWYLAMAKSRGHREIIPSYLAG